MSKEEWVYQVSPKLADGTLINVRANTEFEFTDRLDVLKKNASAIVDAVRSLGAAEQDHAVATVQSVMPGARPVTPAAEPEGDPKYTCKHGPRVLRTSKPGAKVPWTGYFCAAGKDAPDRCDPIFVNS